MAVKRLETYTCYFLNSNTEKQYPTREAALAAAERYVGNRRYAKPIPADDTYLFGPGDGTTSVMVRQDVEFE
jgi:hypothetical protein